MDGVNNQSLLLCPNCKLNIPLIDIKECQGKMFVFVTCICTIPFQKYLLNEFITLLSITQYPRQECIVHNKEADRYCYNCSRWLCSACLIDHINQMPLHWIMPCELCFNCIQHKLNFSQYCWLCKTHLCSYCELEHPNHKLTKISLVEVGRLTRNHQSIIDSNNKAIADFNNIDYDKDSTRIKDEVLIMYNTHKELHLGIQQIIDCLEYTIQLCNNNKLYQLAYNYSMIESILNNSKLEYSYNDTKESKLLYLKRKLYMEFRQDSQYKWVGSLVGHTNTILWIQELNNQHLATIAEDNTIRIWDMSTYQWNGTLIGHKKKILYILELSDGQLATNSEDNTIRVWNLSTYQCRGTIYPQAIFTDYHYLSNKQLIECQNSQLVSYDRDAVQFWDTKTCKKKYTIRPEAQIVKLFGIKHNGNLIIHFQYDSFELWDTSVYQCIEMVKGSLFEFRPKIYKLNSKLTSSLYYYVYSAIFTVPYSIHSNAMLEKIEYFVQPRELSLVLLYFDIKNNCITLNPLELYGKLIGHKAPVSHVIQLQTGNIVSSFADRIIKIWNFETCNCIATLSLSLLEDTLNVFEDCKGQLITHSENRIQVWNMTTYQCICTISKGMTDKLKQLKNGDLLFLHLDINSPSVYLCNNKTYEDFIIPKHRKIEELKDGRFVFQSVDIPFIDIWEIN